MLPPLGLITVAALLPRAWEVRLRRPERARRSTRRDLDWADVVFVSGMLIQRESLHAVARAARAHGKRVVAGGAYASTSPDALARRGRLRRRRRGRGADADAGGGARARRRAAARGSRRDEYPDVKTRADAALRSARRLRLSIDRRAVEPRLPVQLRVLRHHRDLRPRARAPRRRRSCSSSSTPSTPPAFAARSSSSTTTSSATRSRRAACSARSAAWMRAHGDPFYLYTEASLNLAADDALIDAMVDAGFNSVFIGIETPSDEALRHTQKLQNTTIDAGRGRRQADRARPRGHGRLHRRLRHRRRRRRRAAARVDRPLADSAGDGGHPDRAARHAARAPARARGPPHPRVAAATTSCAPTSSPRSTRRRCSKATRACSPRSTRPRGSTRARCAAWRCARSIRTAFASARAMRSRASARSMWRAGRALAPSRRLLALPRRACCGRARAGCRAPSASRSTPRT